MWEYIHTLSVVHFSDLVVMSHYSVGQHLQSNYTDQASPHTTSATNIDLPFLRFKAEEFYTNGLAASTKNTYSAGQLQFNTFCKELKLSALPVTEVTLILFASYLAAHSISHTTIKVLIIYQQCDTCMCLPKCTPSSTINLHHVCS